MRPSRLARLVVLETSLLAIMGLVLGLLVGGTFAAYLGRYGFTFGELEEFAAAYNITGRLVSQGQSADDVTGAGRRDRFLHARIGLSGHAPVSIRACRSHEGGMMVLAGLRRMAWRNLWRNHRRTVIMLLAISIGTWGMIFTTALLKGMLGQMVIDGIKMLPGHVQIHHPAYRDDPSVENSISEPDASLTSGPGESAGHRLGKSGQGAGRSGERT